MKNYVLFLSACLLIFSTACTVNKRAHRPGYNVEWYSTNPQPKKHPKLDEQGSTTEPQESLNGEVEARAEVAESLPVEEQIEAEGLLDEDNTLAGGENSSGILDRGFKIGKSTLEESYIDKPESELIEEAPQQRNSQADNLAIWGFVLSLAAFWIPFLGSLAAVILSSIALNQMRENPLEHRQRGLAIAGLAIGIAGLAFWTGYIFLLILWL
jgi:hypothetical protein